MTSFTLPLPFARHGLAIMVASLFAMPVLAQQTQSTSDGMSTPRPRPPQKSTVTSYHATLESLTVTGVRENASIRLPLKARETPQSVSVTTRKQMDDESLTSVDAVLRHMTGVMTSLHDTQRPLYYTRGFVIKDFQVDGMPSYSGETNQEYDTALYERVDLVRGANGILTGVGTPSATVNLIRKRPTRESGGTVDISAGRWDYYRAVADVNMPITADGSVRSRFVLAPQKKHSFYKRYEENKLAFLGVVEADLGPATEVSVGYQRQKNAPKAPVWGAIPRFNTDGTLANLPVSTSFSPSWTRWERSSGTAFASVSHQINDDWTFKANLDHTTGKTHSLITYGYGATPSDAPFIDKATGSGVTLYAYPREARETRNSLDAYLAGKLHLGGREHDLTVGVSSTRTISKSDAFASTSSWRHDIANVHTWDGSAPKPAVSKTGAHNDTLVQQTGLYASARWRLTEPLSLLTGARVTRWTSKQKNHDTSGALTGVSARQEVKHKVSPYLGVVYDITPSLAAYASHTRIFNPQNYRDVNNVPLKPAVGSNSEVGLKMALAHELDLNLAIFETKQDNFAVVNADAAPNSLPDGSTPYRTVDGTKGKGFDVELIGKVQPDWNLKAALTRAKVTRQESDRLWANFPTWQLQLGSDYRFSGELRPLQLGGFLTWQSKLEAYNVPSPSGRVYVTEKSKPLLDLYASWDFTDAYRLTLAVTNALDKKYWANLDYANYGQPRFFSATFRMTF